MEAAFNFYLNGWRNYAQFKGRARRSEYWYFTLFNTLATLVLYFFTALFAPAGLLAAFYVLASLIPGLAVCFRRLHDTGRSAWWLLIGLIPFGGLVLLVFLVQDSQSGANNHGPNPKGL